MDFDAIDKSEMSAVDCPEDTGVSFDRLANILQPIIARPECVGINFTIYDPDLDPGFEQGKKILQFIKTILAGKRVAI
jgi:arginase